MEARVGYCRDSNVRHCLLKDIFDPMNRLKGTADQYGLPTFIVADAGRTQVQAGSKTVLAIGPGKKALVDSVTGKQRLL